MSTVYGSGALYGTLGIDNVKVGSLLVRDQSLGLIVEEQGAAFHDLNFDGVVGLGFVSFANSGTVPLVDNMISQSALPRREFAFYLHRDPSFGGAILWGGTDTRLHEGELSWFPVVSQTFWALDLVSIAIGEHTFRTRGDLLVDSGTTFFMLPSRISHMVNSEAAGALCTELEHIPPLIFVVKDVDGLPRQLIVRPQEYMVRDSPIGECIPAVVSSDHFGTGVKGAILGEVFMRHYVTVFSRGTDANPWPRVGIARSKQGSEVDTFFTKIDPTK
jgi:hypothetical protein